MVRLTGPSKRWDDGFSNDLESCQVLDLGLTAAIMAWRSPEMMHAHCWALRLYLFPSNLQFCQPTQHGESQRSTPTVANHPDMGQPKAAVEGVQPQYSASVSS